MHKAHFYTDFKWLKKLCVYQRITLVVIIFVFLILLVFLFASNYLQKNTRAEAEQKLHKDLAIQLVQDNPLLKDGIHDYSALKNLFKTLVLLGPRFEFYYLDPQGNILSHSISSDLVVRSSIDIEPLQQFISGKYEFPVFANDPKNSKQNKIFSAAPLSKNENLQGYLFVLISSETYESILTNFQQSGVMKSFSIFIVLTVIILLVVLLILFRIITAPLRQLSSDMQAFRQADYQLKNANLNKQIWCADSRSEIDKLGLEFTDLLAHIDKQFQALKNNDSQRKELLADLSHDLRTPLASMQGYMETIYLKGAKLSEQERHKFMNICLRNLQNLKHLIDQIFELAYLEGGEIQLQNENCSLIDLLYDIKNKFDVAATKKSIQLKVDAPNSNCIVNIDIGKLERVMSNLMENAIRYTPEFGNITIGLNIQKLKVILFVEDTGKGIEQEDLDKIFNARYQGKNKLQSQDKHVGLGLAISQRLVDLFGSILQVESHLDVGTRFFFTLNLSKHTN